MVARTSEMRELQKLFTIEDMPSGPIQAKVPSCKSLKGQTYVREKILRVKWIYNF